VVGDVAERKVKEVASREDKQRLPVDDITFSAKLPSLPLTPFLFASNVCCFIASHHL
jgi:hypothetical protein